MPRRLVAKTRLYLIAGCSLALLIRAGCGTAWAHGGAGHSDGRNHLSAVGGLSRKGVADNFGHDSCLGCGGGPASGTHYTGHDIDGAYWGHHHHRSRGPGDLGAVHGPGSSHNPIVYHPVHGPGSSHNPIIAPAAVVRDHRGHSHAPVIPPGSVVRDHRPLPPHLRACRGGYWENCQWGSVRDHRS